MNATAHTTEAPDLHLRALGIELATTATETREASFVASTAAVDAHGEIVEQDWDLSRFRSNPVVLYAHQSRDLPIGKCTRCEVVNGRLECTIKFASASASPLAAQVYELVKEGTLRAVSVGFIPGDARLETRAGRDVVVLSKNVLHEISIVPIPSNPEAIAMTRAKAFERGAIEAPVYREPVYHEEAFLPGSSKRFGISPGGEEMAAAIEAEVDAKYGPTPAERVAQAAYIEASQTPVEPPPQFASGLGALEAGRAKQTANLRNGGGEAA